MSAATILEPPLWYLPAMVHNIFDMLLPPPSPALPPPPLHLHLQVLAILQRLTELRPTAAVLAQQEAAARTRKNNQAAAAAANGDH